MRQAMAGIDVEMAFRVIDVNMRPRLARYFRAHGFPADDADDLVQNTLARVFQGVQHLENESKFMPWLFTIARNVRLSAIEQRHRTISEVPIDSVDAERDPNPPGGDEIDQSLIDQLWRTIAELPAQQRQCLMLRVRDGLAYEEIARTLRLSVHTVRNHLAQAKKSLRRVLGRTLPERGGIL